MDTLSLEDQALIDAIKARVAQPGQATTMQAKFGYEAKVRPSATPEQIASAEEKLGFALPPLIRELYLQVGDGGFGPRYGLMRLDLGLTAEQMEKTNDWLVYEAAVQSTLTSRYIEAMGVEFETQFLNTNADVIHWNNNYFDYCYHGCNSMTVVDCSEEQLPVLWLDSLTLSDHRSGTLRQWWQDWLNGTIQQV